MDRCLLPYVTFLQEHDPAPFAEYILARELIGDEMEAEDAYAWAKQFALYDDLAGEQREDGSWGAYLSAETATSKNCRYKTTAVRFSAPATSRCPRTTPPSSAHVRCCTAICPAKRRCPTR